MSLRYATIENLQADGVEGGEGQRDAFSRRETELGISNPSRLSTLFPKENIDLVGYNPSSDVFRDDNDGVDSSNMLGNPDFNEGVNLNYEGSPSFNLEATIESAQDKPQHGVPNVRVEKDDLVDPLSSREATSSPRRLGGFGTEYQINDLEKGAGKRETMSKYFKNGIPIHIRGSKSRLGKSDPAGVPYSPLDRS